MTTTIDAHMAFLFHSVDLPGRGKGCDRCTLLDKCSAIFLLDHPSFLSVTAVLLFLGNLTPGMRADHLVSATESIATPFW
jgi:hypothetical protein